MSDSNPQTTSTNSSKPSAATASGSLPKSKADLKAERALLHKQRLEKLGVTEASTASQKNMTKQERRQLQEDQRAAKSEAQASNHTTSKKHTALPSDDKQKKPSASQTPLKDQVIPLLQSSFNNISLTTSPNPQAIGSFSHSATSSQLTNSVLNEMAIESILIAEKKIKMFEHLDEPLGRPFNGSSVNKWRGSSLLFDQNSSPSNPASKTKPTFAIHPVIKSIGLRMACSDLNSSNERTQAMLEAFCIVINDYKTPLHNTMARHLQTYLNPQISYLVQMRPLSIGMGNAIRWLKEQISLLDIDKDENSNKTYLVDLINEYIHERIIAAVQSIAVSGSSKINDGDVILTYGYSNSVFNLLSYAFKKKKTNFSVIVVDNRNDISGQKMVRELISLGMARRNDLFYSSNQNDISSFSIDQSEDDPSSRNNSVSYALITALGYLIKQVTKVILGVEAMMGNGAILCRVGTSMVALAAHTSRVPVLAACETYKFTDKVQLDSVVNNELANPESLIWIPAESDQNWIKFNSQSEKLYLPSSIASCMDYSPLPSNRFSAWPTLNNRRTLSDYSTLAKPDSISAESNPHINVHYMSKGRAIANMTSSSAVTTAATKNSNFADRASVMNPLDKDSAQNKWNLLEKENPLANWREQPNLKLLNITRDITPSEFVSVVITEVGLIPTTSIPVVLREYKI
ncbi:hypothetical protein BB561_000464 [Smittium simulii]|uniref:Translation initiation factor eIF2B subunit delta n=1 Tax=Smittium simulii TaxID=133385 RepID=A0A2T9YZ72_9FUNG|nr:hypothetical protein BB561_000464 [Smittium simulii]